MPKYVIERKVPGVGLSTQDQIQKMAQISNDALRKLGGEVHWIESFFTDDAIFCIYVAPNEELVRKHAQLAGFPADRIIKVDTVVDPATGDLPIASRVAAKEQMLDKSMRQ
ncbi:DUF4242 domain-containing protein [Bdellovibrio svalbardensis]|uniref:DUF4242 domain-containing protein n=1 Tax=Bdellovibrio svalbardensis TaxID=2972972 RepID=A0ABT6DLS7_9BACT|nr:DUF4242 domain-containing protein [Bdellovibrio svalbardensis]MDG0817837.1 DUF4242 domain-containing protein [Bdellovibrio svalbardensis]